MNQNRFKWVRCFNIGGTDLKTMILSLLGWGFFLAPVYGTQLNPANIGKTTDTLNYQWTNYGGSTRNYISVLAADAGFTSIVSSGITSFWTVGATVEVGGFLYLTPGTSYYFKVKVATEDDTNYSAVLTTITRRLGVPLNVAGNGVQSISTNAISLNWLSSNACPACNNQPYKISYGTYSLSESSAAFFYNVTNGALTGLQSNTLYFMHLHVIDVDGTEIPIVGSEISTKTANPPANDDLSAAKNIISTGGYYSDSVLINYASIQSSEPAPACTGGGFSKTVWYRFLATAAVQLTADTLGSNYDTILQLKKALVYPPAFTDLTSETCNDDFAGLTQSKIGPYTLSQGATYYVQVAAYGPNNSGTFLVFNASITSVAVDTNPPTVFISNPQEGMPAPILINLNAISGTAQDTGASNAGVSIVEVRITSGTGGAALDWNGSAWTAPPIWLGANPVITGYSTWDRVAPPSSQLQDGVTYYIRARAKDNSANFSNVSLSSFVFSAPNIVNDNYQNAIVIPTSLGSPLPLPFVTSAQNASALYNLQRFSSCPSGNKDLWWKYVATNTVAVQANTFGSNFDTVLAVWKSTQASPPPSPDSEVSCNDDAGATPQSAVMFQMQTGTTYYFQVYGYGANAGGNVQFKLDYSVSDTSAPWTVNNLTATPDITPGSVRLDWTAPTDNPGAQAAAAYDIRYSTLGPINSAIFFTRTPVTSSPTFTTLPTPLSPGSAQSLIVSNLPQGTTVWFSVASRDNAFNWNTDGNSPAIKVPGGAASAANLSPASASTIGTTPFSDNLQVSYPPSGLDLLTTCGSGKFGLGNSADVWYKYISTTTGNRTANTFNSSLGLDTILQVWQDTGSLGNVSQFVGVGCNDDSPGFGTLSKVSWPLASGGTYYVQIGFLTNGTLKFQFDESDGQNPGQITSLTASPGTNNGEVNLTWIEPADNDYDAASGKVNKYLIRYSSFGSINAVNFSAPFTSTGSVLDVEAPPLTQITPTPVAPGNLVTYTVKNLAQGVTFWFSVKAQDAAGNLSNPSNSPFAPSKAPVAQAGDGQGAVQLRDISGNSVLTSVPVSSQVTVNIRFTVGTSSITAGGKISVRVPDFWGQPQISQTFNPGYVSVSTITPTADVTKLSVSIDPANFQTLIVSVINNGKLNNGDVINISYQNAGTQWFTQTGVSLLVKSQASNSGTLVPIASQPSLNVTAGAPVNVGFTDWNILTLGSGQTSPGFTIEPKDNSWQQATAVKDMKLRIFTLYWDTTTYTYKTDNNAQVSKISPFTPIAQTAIATSPLTTNSWSAVAGTTYYYPLTITNGSVGQTLYYKTSTLGDTILWIEYNNDFDTGFSTFSVSRWFRIRSGSVGFSGLAVTPATISPNQDQTADFATINFSPTVSDAQWRVRIGTDPIFSQLSALPSNVGGGFGGAGGAGAYTVAVSSINTFLDWWGMGQPQNVTWFGNDFMGNVVKNSGGSDNTTYIVRVEDVGGAAVSTTTIGVNSDYLDVFVTTGGAGIPVGVANAFVNANGSTGNGYVYRFKQTGPDGKARIWGFKGGASYPYTLSANFYDPVTQKSLYGTIGAGNAGSIAGNPPPVTSTITFSQPAVIRIHATLPAGAQQLWDQWGGVNVTDNNTFYPVGFGSIRFQAGSLDSDSGWSPQGLPSTWTIINVTNTGSYRLRADMFGYSPLETTLAVTAGNTYDWTPQFVKKPKIYGYVILPSSLTIASYGTWVSVEGTKAGQRFPTSYGGVWFQGGSNLSTGVFAIDVDTGTSYNLKARAFGIGTVSYGPVSVSTSDIGVQTNPNTVIGGVTLAFTGASQGIKGTIKIVGDSTKQNNPFTLFVNAFSQTNYSYGNTQVSTTPNANLVQTSYTIAGLDDGRYQLFTFLDGFEFSPPGPQTVDVVNGAGTLDLTLKQFGGKFRAVFDISPNTDLNKITLNVSGPGVSFSTPDVTGILGGWKTGIANGYGASSGEVIVPNLGTGFLNVSAFYNGRIQSKVVNVVNDPALTSTPTVTFALNTATYAISGNVSVQAFTLGVTASSTGTRIASVSDLLTNTSTETIYVGSGTIFMPIARIEAYPKQFGEFHDRIYSDYVGIGNAPGQGPCTTCPNSAPQFGFGQIRFGPITTAGTYKIDNITPGIYILRHPVNLDKGSSKYNTAYGNSFESNGADVIYEEKTVLVKQNGAIEVLDPKGGDLNFTYSAGAEVSGQIKLPSDIPTDTRFLVIKLLDKRGETVNFQYVYMNGATANYKISNVGNGDFTITVEDERKGDESNNFAYGVPGINRKKYVAKPLSVTINGGNLTGQDVQLYRGGNIEAKLAVVRVSSDGTKTSELITQNNANLLPSGFQVFAFADQFGRGVSGETDQQCSGTSGGTSNCTLSFDSVKNTIRLTYLLPDTDYRVFFGQQGNQGTDVLGKGKLSVVSVEKTGLSVGAGQTLDLGTVELRLGVSISGQVSGLQLDGSTVPAPNVRVSASRTSGHGEATETFTDAKGSYTIGGLDPDTRYYNISFAARKDRTDSSIVFAGGEKKYAQKVKNNVDVKKSTIPLDVVLELGQGSITGKVVSPDSGTLRIPFGEGETTGFPGAWIIANKRGDTPSSNPLGDIELATNLDGVFTIDRLAAGTYDVYALSLGYGVVKTAVTVAAANVDAGTITLTSGLTLSGDIKKPDGTNPTKNELHDMVAATADFSEISIASLRKTSNDTIDGYTVAGLKSGVQYYLLFFSDDDDTIIPQESPVTITTTTSNFNLTYAQSKPDVFMKGKKTGRKIGGVDEYRFEFETTQALRNKTSREKADDYWLDIVSVVTVAGGAGQTGTLSADPNDSNPVSPDRKKAALLYVPPSATATKVTLKFNAFTSGLQPGTSNNFQLNSQFDFFLGLAGQRISRMSMMKGGTINLEGDSSQCQIQGGSFQDTNGNALSVSSNVSVGLQKAEDVNTATTSVSGAPAFSQQTESSLPPVLFNAIKSLKTINYNAQQTKALGAPVLKGAAANASQVASNVLGAFYDFFLPAGVKRTLAKNAKITLQYSTATADPNLMNVYFYNDSNSTMTTTGGVAVPPGAYGLENTSKTVSTTDNTIAVTVSHFTVFVVVNATSPTLGAGVTIVSGSGSSTQEAAALAFTNGSVNIITLTVGTTQPLTGISVSGGASETHKLTLISTGTNSAGIIMNVQSHLQTFSLALNQEQLVDLNDDGKKDLSMKVTGIAGNQATLTLAGMIGLSLPDTIAYTGTEIECFNFPNPFDPTVRGFLFSGTKTSAQQTLRAEGSTAFRFALPSNLGAGPVRVTLEIFDVSGDLIRRLDFGSRATGKYHYADWDGKTENGDTVASGVYIGRLVIDGSSRSKIFKMAVVK